MARARVIVVEVDANASSSAAVAWATRRAAQHDSKLVLACVTHRAGDSYEAAELERQRAQAALVNHSEALAAEGIAHTCATLDLTQSSLTDLAIEEHASLVVVADDTTNTVRRLRVAMRARRVSRRLARTVVTVPATWPARAERWHTV
jgi:hypothetical protein